MLSLCLPGTGRVSREAPASHLLEEWLGNEPLSQHSRERGRRITMSLKTNVALKKKGFISDRRGTYGCHRLSRPLASEATLRLTEVKRLSFKWKSQPCWWGHKHIPSIGPQMSVLSASGCVDNHYLRATVWRKGWWQIACPPIIRGLLGRRALWPGRKEA